MKKIILVAALVFGVTVAASAQPRAVGLRFGYAIEASYQHSMNVKNDTDFLELCLGTLGFGGLDLSATYNIMLFKPEWTKKGDWGVYAGPGVMAGFGGGIHFGIQGQAGLEYTFWFPLQLSVDLRPQIALWIPRGGGLRFYGGGLLGFVPSLSARYKF